MFVITTEFHGDFEVIFCVPKICCFSLILHPSKTFYRLKCIGSHFAHFIFKFFPRKKPRGIGTLRNEKSSNYFLNKVWNKFLDGILRFRQVRLETASILFWAYSRTGVSNLSSSEGHIPKKKFSAGHNILEKSFCGSQFTRKALRINWIWSKFIILSCFQMFAGLRPLHFLELQFWKC